MTNWLVIKSWFIVFRENYWKSINENTVWFMKKNDYFYHNKYDTLSTYCFCNWINHLEKGTPLKYKFKMPIYKPSKN